jgi:hypothetical protein
MSRYRVSIGWVLMGDRMYWFVSTNNNNNNNNIKKFSIVFIVGSR